MDSSRLEFDVAEVLEYDYTYKWVDADQPDSNLNKLFALKVKSCSGYFNNKPFIARPSNINSKQIPLVGEFVLIYKTFNEEATSTKWRETWYWITSIDVQSSINENSLPGLSDGLTQQEIDQIKPGKTFVPKSVSPLQPYEGDVLVEGRFGNSIRFSSTIDLSAEKSYSFDPTWNGTSENGDPIIILSNGRTSYPNKRFVVEDIQTDKASFYLTSTQKIPKLLLGNSNSPNPLTRYSPSESQFANSQFIGTADRVVLKAKTDIVAIDSPKAILLNTTGEIKLGNDAASVSMVHGDVLLEILQQIINQMLSGILVGDTYASAGGYVNNGQYAKKAQQLLTDLLSSKYFIQKNTY